ncbi:Dam family site-specific DNA-(adenine-N6)-methyltransferase [Halomicroarcula limicola]|uniref:site-specific DNA-methyltransferase (adenine-specific) n=1 Tax=Haloarcula limicola TaxID=1429915 RepID=A0A8J7Y7N3_9EURY|nr:Dam family site-specific DNA-(adenine-N6)-methyltransferase [Halomicroarcula limicola]MBV0926220.1 Dam family site-specific DNA-(adenine-N6)-methyltransferase [Halomicroarcula limicola]
MTKPVLKWAGGKRQLLDDLKARFPRDFDATENAYHEPFLGGGALFFDIEPTTGTVNDTNARLVNFYRQVRDNPEKLINRCREFQDPEHDPDESFPFSTTDRSGKDVDSYYYQQRARFNNRPAGDDFDALEEAALLLYLNRTGFNGMYRENADGFFNIPQGRYANPDWVRAEEVRAASRVLERVELYNQDYTYVEEVVSPGDLVYFDPPYEPMSTTADFTKYSADGFDTEDQQSLLEFADSLASEGVHVILSNSGVMYDLYEAESENLLPDTVGATRSINSDGENRGEVEEIIATSVSEESRAGQSQTGLGQFSD